MRLKEVETPWLLLFNLGFGVVLMLFTGHSMWTEAKAAQAAPGFPFMAITGSVLLLFFFLVGLAFAGGAVYTFFEKSRNAIRVDIEVPVVLGGRLRGALGSDRPLADSAGAELQVTLSCKRFGYATRIELGAQVSRIMETTLWSTQQRFPLVAGLGNCAFELEVAADAQATNMRGATGVFWNLAIYFQRGGIYVNRSYRIPVGPPA